MLSFLSDLRYAVRQLMRAPGFAVPAALCLALGVGVNTAVFSVFNSVLLRPFPYRAPEGLVAVFENNVRRGVTRSPVCPADFLDWREQSRTLSAVGAYRAWEPNLTGIQEPERLTGLRASGDLFSLLGVAPTVGRVFLPEDETNRATVVVLSHRLWRRLFGADPSIVGRHVQLDDTAYEVVGVMPPDFQFPTREAELWAPLTLATSRQDRGEHSLQVIARLGPNASLPAVRAELGAMMKRVEAQNDGCGADSLSLRDWYVGSGNRSTLWILLAAVGLVLITASTNVANLLLARGSARQTEFAIRSAIRASRGRLVAQLLAESLVLALVGGWLGLMLAMWSRDALVALLPAGSIYGLLPAVLDWRVMTYTLAAALTSGVIFSLAPVYRYSRASLTASMSSVRAPLRMRGVLLVAQVGLAVMLLAGAGLLLRSFMNVRRIDPGFAHEDVLAARINLPARFATGQRIDFYQQVLQRVAADPQVTAAGAVTYLPLAGGGSGGFITFEGRPPEPGGPPVVQRLIVTPGYFATLGIALRDGRLFSEQDSATSAPVVIVNQAFVRRFWPNENPIGLRIKRGTPNAVFPWLTVVGVIADVRQRSLQAPVSPTIFLPHTQFPEPALSIVVRSTADPQVIASRIRDAVRAVEPNQPVAWVGTLDDVVFGFLAPRWLPLLWMTLFAGLALVLATTGVYAVVSYAVAQRAREFGIRVALGADRADLVRIALRQGVGPALVGSVVGLAAAASLTHVLGNLLVGVSPRDVATFVASALILVLVAVAASYPPARRIARQDPCVALRHE